jgi:hypothetical protein
MSERQGWVKLYRKIQKWELYFSEPFTKTQAWIDMILLANHNLKSFNVRGNIVACERGQIAHSEETLAVRWKWSRGKVRRFLNWLETRQQIEQQKNYILSVVTIVNYSQYQTPESEADSTADDTTDGTTDGQQTVQQTDTNKNVKNYKNSKNTNGNDCSYVPANDANEELFQLTKMGATVAQPLCNRVYSEREVQDACWQLPPGVWRVYYDHFAAQGFIRANGQPIRSLPAHINCMWDKANHRWVFDKPQNQNPKDPRAGRNIEKEMLDLLEGREREQASSI